VAFKLNRLELPDMPSIVDFATYKTAIEDKRDRDNQVRDSIRLKTSERVAWSWLRNQRPVPRWNQEHATERGFYLDFVRPNHVSRLIWELEAEYTPIKGGQVDPDPLARPAVVTLNARLNEEPTFFDSEGDPVVTTAAEFIPGIIRRVPFGEYSVTKNLAQDPKWLQTHLGSVNRDSVRLRGIVWPSKTLMLSSISAGEYKTENRSTFAEFKLSILADPRGWSTETWNVGTQELYQSFEDVRGTFQLVWRQRDILSGTPPEPVSEPVPIDEDGVALVDHIEPDPRKPFKAARLIKLNFEMQEALSWNGVLPLK
jgi:cation transport regulator ChaB